MSKGLDLSNHTLNSSTAKTKYSFSKAQRFFPQLNKPLCDLYYEVPNYKSQRATTFGIGQRNPERTQQQCPSPTWYDDPGELNKAVKKRGFSFGFGREEVKGGLSVDKHAKQLPGPGFYNIEKRETTTSVTLKSRNPYVSNKDQLFVPGPGAYEPGDNLNASGKYYSSKFINSRTGRFNPIPKSMTSRGSRSRNSSPGPGKYEVNDCINEEGKKFNSRFGNSLASRFSKGNRPDMSLKHLLQTPSPGAYRIFSEFDMVPR